MSRECWRKLENVNIKLWTMLKKDEQILKKIVKNVDLLLNFSNERSWKQY